MTVPTVATQWSYAANGVTTAFPYLNKITSADDVVVGVVDGSGNYTQKANGVDYTVSNVGVDAGGNVVFVVAPSSVAVDVRTRTPETQLTSIKNQGSFLPELHEDAFDKLTRAIQDVFRLSYTYGIHAADNETTVWPALPPAATRAGKMLMFDVASGLPTLGVPNTQVITTGLLAPFFHQDRSPAEIANFVIPTDTGYGIGDVRRYGVILDNGVTDNTVAFQNALNANAGYSRVYVPAGGYIKLTGRITAPAGTHIVLESGAELRWTATTATGTNWLGSASRPGLEVLGDNFVLEGRGKLTGPSVGTYTTNEFGILRVGTSRTSPGSEFIVRDVELTSWGSYAIGAQFVQLISITTNKIHDCGYSGVTLLSCTRGQILGNKIYSITPGNGAGPPNGYGINLSHDSTGYSGDPNATSAPRQTVNPFCIGFEVAYNEVQDIPYWAGIDAHGGYELNFHHNRVYNCYIGIQLSASSGAAGNYAGENNSVTDNVIDINRIDGSASTVGTNSVHTYTYTNGIIVNGGSTLAHQGIIVSRNHIVGMGDSVGFAGSGFSIQATRVRGAVISDNEFRLQQGVGVYGAFFDGQISGNTFGPVGTAANSCGVYMAGNNAETIITGNKHSPNGGNVMAVGVDCNTTNATRMVVQNDFNACTAAYGSGMALLTRGQSDIPPRVQVTNSSGGSQTVDLGPLGPASDMYVELAPGAGFTLTEFLNCRIGDRIHVVQEAALTVTVNNSTSAIKLQGGTAAMTQFSAMEFVCVSTSNPKFYEKSRALGNS